MSLVRSGSILALVLAYLVVASACGGAAKPATNVSAPMGSNSNSNLPRSNVEELGMVINVPYVPEDIVWKEYAKPHKLLAVFRFSAEDAAKIAGASTAKGAEPVTVSSEPWFPDELIAQGNLTGDDSLKGQAYEPNLFVQEPFNSGRLVRIEGTDYFVLELDAK